MAVRKIKLGDEIEDITSKTSGICIGECTYLSGATYWIIQPYTADDNVALKELYVPKQYCRRIGDGVYVPPKPHMGFSAEKLEGGNGRQT